MGHDWADGVGERVAAGIREHRKRRGMTAVALAARCKELGLTISRSKIANLEAGERGNVSIAELFVLATALAVPPAALLFGDDMYADVEVLPGVKMSTLDAVSWLAAAEAKEPAALPIHGEDSDYYGMVSRPFLLARIVAEHVAEIDDARRDPRAHRRALEDLDERLDAIRGVGLDDEAPVLPDRIAAELADLTRPAGSRLIPREYRRAHADDGGTA